LLTYLEADLTYYFKFRI